MKCLQALDELELENDLTQKDADARINEEKERMEEKKSLADEATAQYFEFKRSVAKNAVNSRSVIPWNRFSVHFHFNLNFQFS